MYKMKKNPKQPTDENYKIGKQLYFKNCSGCHGELGNGDGPKVKQLVEKSIRPANFKIKEFQREEDGTLFYNIKFGREGMHSWKSKIDDEDIWEIVLHISTFK
jgi:mono/diheme cytochrome c family protein